MSDPRTEIESLLAKAQAEAPDTPSASPSAPPARVLRPVLAALPAERRPATCCSTCEASLWLSSAAGLSSYCRQTHTFSFTPDEPALLLDCDQLHEPLTE